MSILRVVVDIECDTCEAVDTVEARGLSEVRKRARAKGWSNDGRKDFCPRCNFATAPTTARAAS